MEERPIPPRVVLRVDEDDEIVSVDLSDDDVVTDVVAGKPEEPIAPFGDDAFREPYDPRARPWLA
jgi:hypothetical protein